LLAQSGLSAKDVDGHERTEPSHAAVAQAVASGSADAGLGIESAARVRGLDFVPLVREDYYLVCLKSALEQAPVQALLRTLQASAWQARLAQIAGYQPSACGQVLSLRRELPWWSFRRPK
jgi:putative molybdopterin biosynthesis protein